MCKHYWIIPTFPDKGKEGNMWYYGRCKCCGEERKFPGFWQDCIRPHKLFFPTQIYSEVGLDNQR